MFLGLAPVIIRLDEPLTHGSFHILEVVDSKGRQTACGVRAWDSVFEIGTFGNHYFKDFAEAGFNTYQSFGPLSKKKIDTAHELGLRVTAPYFRARRAYFYDKLDLDPVREAVEEVKGHPGLLAYYLEDEPDCFDWRYCGCFGHWFELAFAAPVKIGKVVVHELSAYSRECAVQYWAGGDWREIVRKSAEKLEACPKSKSGRQIEFSFKPIATEKVRLSIPRSSHMPGIRELQVYDASGREIARQGRPRGSSRFLAFYGRRGDEPDKAIDGDLETYWRASHSVPAWVGATGMEMVQRAAFYESLDPRALTVCLVNNTYTPTAWFTYGQVADVFDTDPYVRPSPGGKADYYSVYRRSLLACRASRPRPCFITIWMGWGSKHCRCLTESEERIMAYYAIAAGARGLNYYIHSSSAGDFSVMTGVYAFPKGPARERAREQALTLWQGIARLNKQLTLAGQWLTCGHPVGAVKTVSPGLWARAILCANGAMVVVVVNQKHEATGDKFALEPVREARIEVAVPEWFSCKDALEVTSGGPSSLDFQEKEDAVMLSLPKVEDGKLIVLR